MSSSLTFLVASPHLQGGIFDKAVILLLEHDQQGAMGLMINLATGQSVRDLLPDLPNEEAPCWLGGPVEPGHGWCLYEYPVGQPGEMQLTEGLLVSNSLDVLRAVVSSGQKYMLTLGDAGWSAGQLTEEARSGTWIWVEQSTPDLLWSTEPAERWAEALRRLGVKPDTLVPGGAQA